MIREAMQHRVWKTFGDCGTHSPAGKEHMATSRDTSGRVSPSKLDMDIPRAVRVPSHNAVYGPSEPDVGLADNAATGGFGSSCLRRVTSLGQNRLTLLVRKLWISRQLYQARLQWGSASSLCATAARSQWRNHPINLPRNIRYLCTCTPAADGH